MNKFNLKQHNKGFDLLRVIVSITMIVAVLATVAIVYPQMLPDKVAPLTPTLALLPPDVLIEDKVETILNRMSDEEKVGQLLIIGIDNTEADENALTMLRKYHISGITLFDRNMDNPAQVARLSDALQKEALKQKSQLPLFICIDQEGGQVARMADKVTVAPSQEKLATSGQIEQATVWAKGTARELKAMGINVNFAPVVDLGAAYGRSYGKDPAQVIAFARAAAQGYQQEGLLFSLKHFPGIGRTKVDPHLDPYVIEADRKTLEQEDLAPFRTLIQEMDNQGFFVMVSHLKYLALDGEYPASVSELILTKLLRQELGFQGLIVTDDMEMGALTKLYSFEQMGYLAVKAGADQLLVCHDSTHQIAVYNGILGAVRRGQLDQTTLDNAVRRVIKVKLQHVRYSSVDPENATHIVGK